jgi:tetratricopeptide (TPR) repeat protein
LELSLKKWETFPQEERDASTIAANLSELTLTVGNVKEAVEHGYRSVELARKSGNASAEMTGLARVAAALHQAGRLQESREVFQEAEKIQAKQRPDRPRLSALRGYQYCDLLRSLGEPADGSMLDGLHASRSKAAHYRNACEEVVNRAEEMLSWSEQTPGIFGGALDHLALGQAKLGLAITTSPEEETGFEEALEHLNEAVERIQQRHLDEGHLPSALLARARFHLFRGEDLQQAKRDLERTLEIADSGPMRLLSCDAHCGLAAYIFCRVTPRTRATILARREGSFGRLAITGVNGTWATWISALRYYRSQGPMLLSRSSFRLQVVSIR